MNHQELNWTAMPICHDWKNAYILSIIGETVDVAPLLQITSLSG